MNFLDSIDDLYLLSVGSDYKYSLYELLSKHVIEERTVFGRLVSI